MTQVAEGVEPDQIGAEQAVQDFPPPRQHAEHFGGRKRNVKKESAAYVGMRRRRRPGTSINW